MQSDALAPEAAGQRRQPIVGREAGAALELGSEAIRVAGEGLAEGLEDDAGGDRRGLEDQAGHAVLAQLDQAGDALGELGRGDRVRGAGRPDVGPDVRQLGVAQVEVARVELVRLQRECLEGLECRDPFRPQPGGFGAFSRERLGEILVGEGKRKIGRSPASRARFW